jgi:hypothetical protein
MQSIDAIHLVWLFFVARFCVINLFRNRGIPRNSEEFLGADGAPERHKNYRKDEDFERDLFYPQFRVELA